MRCIEVSWRSVSYKLYSFCVSFSRVILTFRCIISKLCRRADVSLDKNSTNIPYGMGHLECNMKNLKVHQNFDSEG